LAYRTEPLGQRLHGTKYRDAYVFPQINLEDLSKPKTLLLFLQARARNEPDVFANSDGNVNYLGRMSGAVASTTLEQYAIVFSNRKTPETYGEVITTEGKTESFVKLNGWGTETGLEILEMQQRIMRFLLDCCKAIMHDFAPDTLTSHAFPVLPAVVLPKETADGFASLAIMAQETPYRVPAHMDLERLELIIETHKSDVEDHIWTLREDPDYFTSCIQDCKDHSVYFLKDTNGRDHPLSKPNRKGELWTMIISRMVASAHYRLESWAELLTQVKSLRALQAKHAQNISLEKELPKEYSDALYKFACYCLWETTVPRGELMYYWASSPPMRQYYLLRPFEDEEDPRVATFVQKEGVSERWNSAEKELHWLLDAIFEDGFDLKVLSLPGAVDELQRLIQSEPDVRNTLKICVTIGRLCALSTHRSLSRPC
jgi:hypothetical protein